LVADGTKAEGELPEWRSKLNEVARQRDAAVAEFDKKLYELNCEVRVRNDAISNRQAAMQRLLDTAGADIREMLVEIDQQVRTKNRELSELRREAAVHEEAHLSNARNADKGTLEKSGVDGLQGSYDRLQARKLAITAKENEIVELDQQVRRIQQHDALLPENF
jgi:phage I-like protein